MSRRATSRALKLKLKPYLNRGATMSDDRFKQARRSLINQQQRGSGPPASHPGGAGDADESTALVDINELRAGAAALSAQPHPPTAYPSHAPAPSYEDASEATQMVDINAFTNPGAAPQPAAAMPGHRPMPGGVRTQAPPAYDEPTYESMQAIRPQQPRPPMAAPAPMTPHPSNRLVIGQGSAPASSHEASTQFVDIHGLQAGAPPAQPAPPMRPGAPPIPNYATGGAGTQTLDLDDLQEVPPTVAPDPGVAGYEGSTQFVDLNKLALGTVGTPAGVPQPNNTPPQSDPLLAQSYLFGPDGIQQYGAHTLIFARNQQGQDVVLKRVWAGHPDQMPEALRQKITLLGQIQHNSLARMNGVFASYSGCWVELERPQGMRLTHTLQNGPMTREAVAEWAFYVADVIRAAHAYGILYANLTTDAIWLDEATGAIKLEPFDVLSFEERGNLGPFGPPELHQPTGAPPNPSTDVYTFAAVIVTALVGIPDPNQVGRITPNKLQQALIQGLESNPNLRPTTFDPILEALGSKAKSEPAKGIDKRLAIPVVIVVVALLGGVLFWPSDKTPQAPPQYRQEGLPERPAEDRAALAEPPSAVEEDEQITVLTSYAYAPPEKKSEAVDEQALLEHAETARAALKESRTLQNSDEAYSKALQNFSIIYTARKGKLTPKEKELYEELMSETGLRAYRQKLIETVEKPLLDNKDISTARISYRTLSNIDPHSNTLSFFERYNKAKVSFVTSKAPTPPEEAEEEE